jgi:tryptophan 2,3-dioxygenase
LSISRVLPSRAATRIRNGPSWVEVTRASVSAWHEDRDDDLVGAALGKPDQRHVTVMERTHGRHQRDGGLSAAKMIDGAPQGRDRADDQGTAGHLDSAG